MKRSIAVLFAVVLAALAADVAAAHPRTPRIHSREIRQQSRIRQGWRSGELTARERARLEVGQRRVHRMEWRARRDGIVTPYERRRLARAQGHESRAIYRLKHNDRQRRG